MFNLFGPPNVSKLAAKKDVDGLINALNYQKTDSRKIILEAIEALGELRDVRAVQPLSVTLKNPDDTMRKASMTALVKIGDASVVNPLIGRLNDNSNELQKLAVDALATIGVPAIPELIKTLKNNFVTTHDRIKEVLVKIGTPAVEPLMVMLQDKDAWARQCAADALGSLKDKRAAEPLIQALKDTNGDVRKFAAAALGKIGDETALLPLIEALKDSSVPVRRAAAATLGIFHREEASDGLIQALIDSDKNTREGFSAALVKIGISAAPKVLAAFQDASLDWHARYYLALTLGGLKDPGAVAPLAAVLREGCQEELRFGIISALTSIGGPAAEDVIKQYNH